MSDTAVAINIVVLLVLIIFSIQRLGGHGNQNSSKTTESLTSKENINLRGVLYDQDAWRVTLPQSVLENLEVCFDGDKNKAHCMKRAIELSLEHYTFEMEDDKECADIIEKRHCDGTRDRIPLEEMLQQLERNKKNSTEEKNNQVKRDFK
ncbi:MAG: hypothetical protein WCW84_10400 [Sulfurimonas sp.]|jgi:hypothetical protein